LLKGGGEGATGFEELLDYLGRMVSVLRGIRSALESMDVGIVSLDNVKTLEDIKTAIQGLSRPGAGLAEVDAWEY